MSIPLQKEKCSIDKPLIQASSKKLVMILKPTMENAGTLEQHGYLLPRGTRFFSMVLVEYIKTRYGSISHQLYKTKREMQISQVCLLSLDFINRKKLLLR